MKGLLFGLILMSSYSYSWAQTEVVLAYQCEIDLELRYVGRPANKVAECRYEFETSTLNPVKSKILAFRHENLALTKSESINKFVKLCQDLTEKLGDGEVKATCTTSNYFAKRNGNDGLVTKEGVTLATDLDSVVLADDADQRVLDVLRTCKQIVKASTTCETIKKIIQK